MLKSDVLKFLKDVNKIYPSWKIDDYQGTVDMWYRYLEKQEEEHVYKALDEYVTVERNKYAPSVSDIVNLAKKYIPDSRFDGIVYWNNRTKENYPFAWDSNLYEMEYANGLDAEEFCSFLIRAVREVENKDNEKATEEKICTLDKVFGLYRKWKHGRS